MLSNRMKESGGCPGSARSSSEVRTCRQITLPTSWSCWRQGVPTLSPVGSSRSRMMLSDSLSGLVIRVLATCRRFGWSSGDELPSIGACRFVDQPPLWLPPRIHRPLVAAPRSILGPAVDTRLHESHLGPDFDERSLFWLSGDSVERPSLGGPCIGPDLML